jgi:hypothetical protein
MGKTLACNVGVRFDGVRGAELSGRETARNTDKEFSRLVDRLPLLPLGFGEKDGAYGFLVALRFGWAISFCSLSKTRAALAVLNDFRLRWPVRSRQSA